MKRAIRPILQTSFLGSMHYHHQSSLLLVESQSLECNRERDTVMHKALSEVVALNEFRLSRALNVEHI